MANNITTRRIEGADGSTYTAREAGKSHIPEATRDAVFLAGMEHVLKTGERRPFVIEFAVPIKPVHGRRRRTKKK